MDDSEADFFGDAGKEKRTLVDNLLASVDEEAVVDDVAGVVAAWGCWACCRCLCSVAVDDIDASDSAGTSGAAIDVTVIVDVDVGVVGVVVIVIVIVAVDVLGEQLLVVSSCPSLFPTVPLLCLVCEQFSSNLPRQTIICAFYIFFITRRTNFGKNEFLRKGNDTHALSRAKLLTKFVGEEIFVRFVPRGNERGREKKKKGNPYELR